MQNGNPGGGPIIFRIAITIRGCGYFCRELEVGGCRLYGDLDVCLSTVFEFLERAVRKRTSATIRRHS